MLKKFQKYTFSSILITGIIAIIVWLGAFITPYEVNLTTQYSPLFKLFLHWFSIFGRGTIFISFLLIILQAAILATFTNKTKIFEKNTFIAGIIFIVISSIPQIQTFNPVLIANTFVIFAIKILIQNISKKSAQSFFLSAILFAIASLIYYQYILISIFAIISVVIIRSKITKEILTVILGFTIIYLLYIELFYLTQGHGIKIQEIVEIINQKAVKFENSIYFIIFISFSGFIFLISNSFVLKRIGFKEIDNRTAFQFIFAFLFFTIISYLIIPSIGMNFLISFAIPLSVLFGDYFVNIKNKFFNRTLFFLFIFSGLIFYVKHIINLFQ